MAKFVNIKSFCDYSFTDTPLRRFFRKIVVYSVYFRIRNGGFVGGLVVYLSRIEVNPFKRETMRALAELQRLHAAVMAGFPGVSNPDKGDRLLWRVDRLGDRTYVLVQSSRRPDLQHMVEQFGWPASGQTWDTRDYEPFLARIRDHQHWRFRLRANPVTHSEKKEDVPPDAPRGKVFAHVTAAQQKKWLFDRSRRNGFRLSAASDAGTTSADFEVMQREVRLFRRGDKYVTIAMVAFEGVLIVENAGLLVDAMKKGIGRAKAYGCGLLTLAEA